MSATGSSLMNASPAPTEFGVMSNIPGLVAPVWAKPSAAVRPWRPSSAAVCLASTRQDIWREAIEMIIAI